MIKRVPKIRSLKFLSPLLFVTLIAACSKEKGVDYCDDHFLFHADHQEAVASLDFSLSDAGELSGSIAIPSGVFGEATVAEVESLLSHSENSFRLQSATPCAVAVTNFSSSNESYAANFSASCGSDNKLSQIDVALFDHLPGLEEAVVVVTTAATTKRFGISRQCDKPIFRLD